MSLSPYTIVIGTKLDAPYNVIPNAEIEIRHRNADGTSGSLALIFEDPDGLVPITQTGATVNDRGTLTFYAAAAGYNAVYNNGSTVTQPIDVGVTADNLINDLSQAYIFDTVADMIASTIVFPVGKRLGRYYHERGDTGYVDGVVKTAAQAAADGDVIDNDKYGVTLADGNVWIPIRTRDIDLNRVGRPGSTTAAASGAGVLTGTYYYSYSFVTVQGETEVSTPSNALVLSANQATVDIPVSANNKVTARRIYRTVANDDEPTSGKLVAEVSDNTTLTYVDNIADGSLGVRAPHFDTTGGQTYDGTDVVENIGGLSTKAGKGALESNAGYACTAYGAFALKENNGGYRNTGFGTDALLHNVLGYNNTGVGVHAGNDCVDGHDNSWFGLSAGFKNLGFGNTVFGSNALSELVNGNENSAFGSGCAQLKTGGSGNTFFGAGVSFAAGDAGIGNTCFGVSAVRNMTGGNFNTFVGYNAGYEMTTASGNTAIGDGALRRIGTGENCIAVGRGAGEWETTANKFWVDAFTRTDLSDAKVKSLMYGELGSDRFSQKLDVNGQVNFLAGLGISGRDVNNNDTVTVDDTALTCFTAGAITLDLTPCDYKQGKVITLRNHAAHAVTSTLSNIQQIGGGARTSAILPATIGSWVVMRQNDGGVDWDIIMQG